MAGVLQYNPSHDICCWCGKSSCWIGRTTYDIVRNIFCVPMEFDLPDIHVGFTEHILVVSSKGIIFGKYDNRSLRMESYFAERRNDASDIRVLSEFLSTMQEIHNPRVVDANSLITNHGIEEL